MKVKWVPGKVISTLTLAPGIYAHVYYELLQGEQWCYRASGNQRVPNFKTRADAMIAAEEYLCDIINSAMNNIYN